MRIIDTPIQINGTEIANRLVMPPMATLKSSANGSVSQELCDYYHEKTLGGYIGLVITEHAYISPEGKAGAGQLSLDSECEISGLKKLTATIHANNTKVFCQINHAGSAAQLAVTGLEAISASDIPLVGRLSSGRVPRKMDSADMERLVGAFAASALRAKESGYDGVEIHSAHGYLLNQFYSPLTNHRDDAYTGKTLEGRIKLHLQVIQAVREAVGKDFPVALRLGACDYSEGGSTIDDAVLASAAFERAGIDLLDISGGLCGYINPYNKEQGYFCEISERIKKEVSIPVILTGGIVDIEKAEALLSNKKADLIGVGRAILKDSTWAQKAMTRAD